MAERRPEPTVPVEVKERLLQFLTLAETGSERDPDDVLHELFSYEYDEEDELHGSPPASNFENLDKYELCELIEGMCSAIYPVIDYISEPYCDKTDFAEKLRVRHGKELDEVKKERDELFRKTVALQEQIIELQNQQLNRVTESVQKDLSSFAAVVSQNCRTALAPNKLQTALRAKDTAVKDATDRSKNLMVFGLPEPESESVDVLKSLVEEVLAEVDEKPVVVAKRVGLKREGAARPVIVKLESREMLLALLRKAKQLRQSEKFSRVYLARDLTPAERTERRGLYKTLNQLRESNPGGRFRVRNGAIDFG